MTALQKYRDQQADDYGFQIPYDDKQGYYDNDKLKHFKAGFDAAIAYIKEHPEEIDPWVSVDFDKPEIGEYVLVNVGTDTVLKGRYLNDGWVAFFSDGEIAVGEIRPVTHWKYLPAPPIK